MCCGRSAADKSPEVTASRRSTDGVHRPACIHCVCVWPWREGGLELSEPPAGPKPPVMVLGASRGPPNGLTTARRACSVFKRNT